MIVGTFDTRTVSVGTVAAHRIRWIFIETMLIGRAFLAKPASADGQLRVGARGAGETLQERKKRASE